MVSSLEGCLLLLGMLTCYQKGMCYTMGMSHTAGSWHVVTLYLIKTALVFEDMTRSLIFFKRCELMKQFGPSAVPDVSSQWNVTHMNGPVA